MDESRQDVLEEMYFSLSQILQANDHLDYKALLVLIISSLLIGTSTSSYLLFVALSICCVKILFFSGTTFLPGTFDWEKVYNDYLSKEPKEEYEQVLSDILSTYEDNKKVNSHKGIWLQWMSIIFVLYTFVAML